MPEPAPEKISSSIRKAAPYVPLLLFVTLAVLLAGISIQAFRQMETLTVRDQLNTIGAIANLKAKRIDTWHRRQIRRGETFHNGNLMPEYFDLWLRQGALPDSRKKKIQEILAGLRVDGYQEISLFDPEGLVRVSTAKEPLQDREDVALVAEAMRSRKVLMSDLRRRENKTREISISLAAPLVVADANGEQVVGAVLFQIDLYHFLYPLLQEWPTPSPSAETLLVRRDGNEVLFLNELRHLKGNILSLRIPLTRSTLPAVMAVHGKTSSVDGFDYRGVPVVAEMRKVPGTEWFLVSKVDKEELLAPITRLKQWALSLGLVFTLLGGLLLSAWLKANQTRQKLLKEQHAAAVEREMLLTHFEYLNKYANDIILVVDETGRILEANERAVETYGYTREELLSLGIPDLQPPTDDPSVFNWQMKQILESGKLCFEDVNRHRDGTNFLVEVSARLMEVQGVRFIQGILRDITVRKYAEEELRLHSAIVSHMEEGVLLTSVRDGMIVFANPKFEQMFGYEFGGLIGIHVSSINDPAFGDPEALAISIGEVLIREGAWEGEVHNVKRDGTPFWCYASVSTFEHHRYGTVWVSIHQDITERKLAESRLRESEERFRVMADKAPIMIWMAEASNQRHDCRNFFNQMWHDFTGLSSAHLLDHRWYLSVHPDDRANCLDKCEVAFRNAARFRIEYRLRRHDGVFCWVQDTGVPRFAEDGKFLGHVGICVDMTDQKLFEEMRTEIERIGRINIVGEMTSLLAHELSQPLSAASIYLDGCLNLMGENDWDKEQLRNGLKLARVQAQRAGKVINRLKELTRKEGCQSEMIDINSVIKDSVTFLQQDLDRHFIVVSKDFGDLPLISANRTEIEQVLLNLMKNATEALSSQPRRELRLATRLQDGMVLVTVSDTGTGIFRDDMENIFNPFQTTKQKGLGLGLGICRSLIEGCGGKIWAEPRSDCGMEFNFTLPVVVTYE